MSREHDITNGVEALRYIARGWTIKATASELDVNVNTAGKRLQRLYEILGARSAAHAVVIAGVLGLLSPDDLRAALADRPLHRARDVRFWARPRGVVLDVPEAAARVRGARKKQKEAD